MIVQGGGAGNLAPVGIGAMLMVMIYAGGHISGAHYNPAVTLGVFLRGGIKGNDVPGYMVAQIIGAFLATIVGALILGSGGAEAAAAPMSVEPVPGLLAEFLGTFALVYVILNVATAKSNAGNSHYGAAIGFTVTACAYAFGGVSGGAFNPAVALGLGAAEMVSFSDIWIHLLGELAAGAAAAFTFLFVNGKD
jgi:aquaporin Z